MKDFLFLISNEIKAALHWNKYMHYALLLAVYGFIFIIGLVVLMVLSARISPLKASQDTSLVMVEVTNTPFQPLWTGTISPNCYGPETHTIGQGIADKFKMPYGRVMTWFCSGYEFEDILLALQTTQQVDMPVERLLDLRTAGHSWDGIWRQIGLTE